MWASSYQIVLVLFVISNFKKGSCFFLFVFLLVSGVIVLCGHERSSALMLRWTLPPCVTRCFVPQFSHLVSPGADSPDSASCHGEKDSHNHSLYPLHRGSLVAD